MKRAVELRKRQRAGSGLNDTIVILSAPHPLELTGAARDRPAALVVGSAAARGGQAATRRAGQDRCLPGRRAVRRAVADAVRPSGWGVRRSRSPRCCHCFSLTTAVGWATRACAGMSATRAQQAKQSGTCGSLVLSLL